RRSRSGAAETRPIATYAAEAAKTVRSIPRFGSSTKAASGGPHIAPVVFATVNHADARVGAGIQRLSAAASNVKRTPERNDVGNASAAASHRTRVHSAICAPVVVH